MSEPWAAWTPEDNTAARAAAPGGFAGLLGQVQPDPGEGRTLEEVFERARRPGKPEEPPDADEREANLRARRYQPGALSGLSRQLADTQAELATEEEKIERGRKRQERIQRDHLAGKITAFDIARMQDFDEGDASRAAMLARRCERLRQQIAQASELIAGPQRDVPADPVEAATRHARQAAHELFRETTRERLGAPRQRRERPFASHGGGDAPDCPVCAAMGASRSESAKIHAGEVRRVSHPAAADRGCYEREVTRLMDAGFSLDTARLAATPAGVIIR
jgi:hypothetical protein